MGDSARSHGDELELHGWHADRPNRFVDECRGADDPTGNERPAVQPDDRDEWR